MSNWTGKEAEIGARIKELMKGAKITNKYLSERLNMDANTFSRKLRGHNERQKPYGFDDEQLAYIAEILNVTIEYLKGDSAFRASTPADSIFDLNAYASWGMSKRDFEKHIEYYRLLGYTIRPCVKSSLTRAEIDRLAEKKDIKQYLSKNTIKEYLDNTVMGWIEVEWIDFLSIDKNSLYDDAKTPPRMKPNVNYVCIKQFEPIFDKTIEYEIGYKLGQGDKTKFVPLKQMIEIFKRADKISSFHFDMIVEDYREKSVVIL